MVDNLSFEKHENTYFTSYYFLAITATAEDCNPKEFDSIRKCYSTFFANYNLTLGPDNALPDYFTFSTKRGKITPESTKTGIKKGCAVQSKFSNCIGPNSACINKKDLPQIFSKNEKHSVNYIIDYFASDYQCGKGYNIAINYFDCIMSIGRTKGKEEAKKCTEQRVDDMEKKIEICIAQNSFTKCSSSVFKFYCGKEVGNDLCNIQTIVLIHAMPECIPKVSKCDALTPE